LRFLPVLVGVALAGAAVAVAVGLTALGPQAGTASALMLLVRASMTPAGTEAP
jgi:hypothetical protein